jgi:hypothetical protein
MFGSTQNTAAMAAPKIPQTVYKTATATAPTPPAAPPKTAAANVIPVGNTITSAQKMQVTISNVVRNTGNTVTGPEGFANQNNAVAINGAKNTINLAGAAPAGMSAATFTATGGANIDNTRVTVTGDQNKVTLTGQNQQNNTMTVNGTGNTLNVGSGVANANLNVSGNNVQVNMGANDVLKKNQSNWNVSVSASNVSVTIENGQATVQGLSGNTKYTAQIDQEKRTVTISEVI